MNYRDLTDEQKAKISGKTPEDLFSIAKNEGVELSEKEMEPSRVAGTGRWPNAPNATVRRLDTRVSCSRALGVAPNSCLRR